MKKFIFSIIAMLTMFVGMANASNNSTNELTNYKMNVNVEKLAHFLNVNDEMKSELKITMGVFIGSMDNAAHERNKDARDKMVLNAVEHNLNFMHSLLTNEQMRKYRMVLNATLSNRDILPSTTR